MKKIILILFFVSTNSFAQYSNLLEPNPNLQKYSRVKIVTKPGHGWVKKIKLDKGKISYVEYYHKSKLTSKFRPVYNADEKLLYEINEYNLNEGYLNDTIKYDCSNEKYSQINNLGFPEIIERSGNSIDSIFGYREELKYNLAGNLIERKVYSKINNQIYIAKTEYKYDSKNNVIELNRSNNLNDPYPTMIDGGRPQYKNEKFRYQYNKDNLWVKQYWTVEGKEYLIERRDFK